MKKETKIPFFTSLTNSGLVKHSCQENNTKHLYRKEKTEITILSQETTNIKIKIKSKVTILRKQLASVDPKKKKKNHLTEKQPTSIHKKKKKKKKKKPIRTYERT